jgi:hypothetical protein
MLYIVPLNHLFLYKAKEFLSACLAREKFSDGRGNTLFSYIISVVTPRVRNSIFMTGSILK